MAGVGAIGKIGQIGSTRTAGGGGLPRGHTWTTYGGDQVYYAPIDLVDEFAQTIPSGSLFRLTGSPRPSGSRRVADDGFSLYAI